ncbi:hypothetical protein [Motiliproteus sediminis]|uniref:hypothetical protein n=1 Tax=Motiliproteus sediminis TaxID=1468178 RepID=UPI001AEFB9E1|nr:hypothetical protein [Motiliproteus sediminis]
MNPLITALALLLGLSMVPAYADNAATNAAPPPELQRLQALQNMRLRLEQDWAGYLQAARNNASAQPVAVGATPEVAQMRQQVTHNLERLEDRFRCLDVDLNGNNGNVVLICGDNNGRVDSNNQQALGADLNVSGGTP